VKTRVAALLSLALVISACAPAISPGGDITLARADVPRTSAAPADTAAAGSAITAFGLDLYRAVAKGKTNLRRRPASD